MKHKKFLYGLLSLTLITAGTAPIWADKITTPAAHPAEEQATTNTITHINLSDAKITVNGQNISASTDAAVYTSHDIIYYEDKETYESGNPYGEGSENERHSAEEAAKHTVVNITKPGTYRLSGKLSYGQIFVNVGKEETDKVTLILDNVDINCTVAPAVLFKEVYECDANATAETASSKVDTTNAGAHVIIADDSTNNITGSHVAKIYKDTTQQKKRYKYDGAFYSCMSMNIDGETKGNGVLNIHADNEGLDSELHLTINGGHINIQSADDGINVNEDGISVFTMNDGYLSIYAGNGAEGDGIDSNGWNVINGGTVLSLAHPKSPDGGIDSDMGTFINGGTVIGAGNMYDPIENDSKQNFMCLQLNEKTEQLITVTDDADNPIFAYDFPTSYTYIVFSTPTLATGTYHVYQGGTITGTETNGYYDKITSYLKGTKLHHGGTSFLNVPQKPQGEKTDDNMPEDRPELPNTQNGQLPPELSNAQNDQLPSKLPDGEKPGNPPAFPHGKPGEIPAMPNGDQKGGPKGPTSSSTVETYDFVLSKDSKVFTNVSGSALAETTK